MNGDQDEGDEYAAAAVPTVSEFWTLAEDGTYVLLIDEGNTTNYGFFADSGYGYNDAYMTITVNGEDADYSTAGASEKGTYTVVLTLNEGYTWTDGTEGSKTFTFIVYYGVDLESKFASGYAVEGGSGTEDDPYLVAYDTTASTLFDSASAPDGVTAIGYAADDTEGTPIEDLTGIAAGAYVTIVFSLEENYAWEDGTTSDRWYAFVSVTAVVAKPDAETLFTDTGWYEKGDDYAMGDLSEATGGSGNSFTFSYSSEADYTIAVEGLTATDNDGTYTITIEEAGTFCFYLMFALTEDEESENVWEDGTTEDITLTIVIGGNVPLLTSSEVIGTEGTISGNEYTIEEAGTYTLTISLAAD